MADPNLPPLPSNPNDNAGPRILGATLTTACLAIITVATRFYVRTFMVKALGWDDFFIALALVVSITSEIFVALSVKYGAGQHIGDVPPDTYRTGMKLNFISQPLMQWGLCIFKLSVGCALLRIATQKRWRYPIIGLMVFMVAYTIGTFQTFFTQCEQVAMQWDNRILRKCWSPHTLQALAFSHSALNIFTDFIFAVVIPIPLLWSLQMNKRTKGAVIVMLSLGVFVMVAGLVRIPYVVNYGKAGDFLWDSSDLSIWFVTEMNLGIITASMPALKPIFKAVAERTYARGGASQGYGGYGHNSRAAHHSFSGKVGNIRTNTERLPSHDQYDVDSDGSQSQRHLVIENSKPIALGIIQKNVTTTISHAEAPMTPTGGKRNAWDG